MKEKINTKLWAMRLGFIIIGGALGYLYWKEIGCASGTCPITSKWLNTTLYGGVLGFLIGDLILDMIFKNKKVKE